MTTNAWASPTLAPINTSEYIEYIFFQVLQSFLSGEPHVK